MRFIIYTLLLFTLPTLAQTGKVGIGTTDPKATLDVAGNLRIRSVDIIAEVDAPIVAKDSILVSSQGGIVYRVSSKSVYESHIKTAVRGTFPGTGPISITLGSNVATIPFESEDFDTNDEFNTSTHTFTAKQDGYYQVYAQINSAGALGASTNYGLRILKNTTIVAEQNFANLNLLVTNITPPVRNVQTTVQLNEGETISFQLYTNLLSVSLLGDKSDSFFTIHQIR